MMVGALRQILVKKDTGGPRGRMAIAVSKSAVGICVVWSCVFPPGW